MNSYSYAGNNPIIGKDPEGRDYLDYGVALILPRFLVGPAVNFYYTPGNSFFDQSASLGISAGKPGPSGSITYSPGKSPEGSDLSLSLFFRRALGLGGQVSLLHKPGMSSSEYGFGFPPGGSLNLSYTTTIGNWLNILGGSLQNETTPMTINSILYPQINQSYNFTNISSGSNIVPPKVGNMGGGSFVGTYDFGPGLGVYDYGKQQWVSPQNPTSNSKESACKSNCVSAKTLPFIR